jgi:voltage-gated potassium channel
MKTPEPHLRRRILAPLISLLVLVGLGTVGYRLIERASWLDGLYMTIITLATVGFREVVEVRPAGKIFTIWLIAFGVVLVGWAVRRLMDITVGEQLVGARRQRRMGKKIRQMQDHYIICGYGRTGSEVVSQMRRRGVPLVVVDVDEEKLAPLAEGNVPYLVGDATQDEVLLAAGIEQARGLVAAAGTDAVNIFISLTARGLNPRLFIVARSLSEEDEAKLRRAGADRVVSSHVIGGRRIAAALLRPTVVDFLDIVTHGETLEFELEEIPINTHCRFAGQTLRSAQIREQCGLTVLGKRRADGQFLTNPSADMTIDPGDILVVVGTAEQLSQLRQMAGVAG